MYLFLGRLIGILDVGIGPKLSLERLKKRTGRSSMENSEERDEKRVQKRLQLKCPRSHVFPATMNLDLGGLTAIDVSCED